MPSKYRVTTDQGTYEVTTEDAPQGDAARSVGQMLGNAASNYGEQVNPVNLISGLAGAVRHPIDTTLAISNQLDDLRNKAVDAYKKGDYKAAAVHALSSFVPAFGPSIDKGGMQMLGGDYSGGVGTLGGAATLAALPKIASEAAPLVKGAAPVVADAVVGAVKGGAELKPRFGVQVPASIEGGIAGGAAARALGLPATVGAIPGALAPMVRGGIEGVQAGRAARAAAARIGADRVPVWQGPQPEASALPEVLQGPMEAPALASGRVPGRYDPNQPAPAPPPERVPLWQGIQQGEPQPVLQPELPPPALPSGRVPGRYDPANPPVADWRERLAQIKSAQEAAPAPEPAAPTLAPTLAPTPAPAVEASPAPAVQSAGGQTRPTFRTGPEWDAAYAHAAQNGYTLAGPTPMEVATNGSKYAPSTATPAPEPAPVIPPKAATRELPNPIPAKTTNVVTGNEFETAARYTKAQALAKFLYADGDGVPHVAALQMDPNQWALAQKGAGVAGPPSPKTIALALDELKKLETSQPIAKRMAAEVNAPDVQPEATVETPAPAIPKKAATRPRRSAALTR